MLAILTPNKAKASGINCYLHGYTPLLHMKQLCYNHHVLIYVELLDNANHHSANFHDMSFKHNKVSRQMALTVPLWDNTNHHSANCHGVSCEHNKTTRRITLAVSHETIVRCHTMFCFMWYGSECKVANATAYPQCRATKKTTTRTILAVSYETIARCRKTLCLAKYYNKHAHTDDKLVRRD